MCQVLLLVTLFVLLFLRIESEMGITLGEVSIGVVFIVLINSMLPSVACDGHEVP